MVKVTQIIHKLSTARMEFQTSNGSVLNSFVVPFFIDKLDLRKISHTIALAGSRGSGKSTYIQYFSHSTRFDIGLSNVSEDEFECILLYWKPDIAYCQGLKSGWLGENALRFFSLHAALSLLQELAKLIKNISHHFPDLESSLNDHGNFWRCISNVTKNEISTVDTLNSWIMDYQYQVSTRLNPINLEGLLSIEPKQMLVYLIDSLRLDYEKFRATTFKIFIDEFELLNIEQQRLINTYRKESTQLLNWNVAYKHNAKPTNETTSDQWLQSPDDYVEENLDEYIKLSDFEIFAAEIFLLTLQNAGLNCKIDELSPPFLGDRKNIDERKQKLYKDKVISIIQGLLPTPKISELSEICISNNSVKTKLKESLSHIKLSESVKKKLIEDEKLKSLAITIIGTYKQRNFSPDLIEKYVNGLVSESERRKVTEKISTYEFNTLLSLNLQHASIQVPVYSGFDRFITMTTPNIRHFKELCLSTLKQYEDKESIASYEYIEDIKSISYNAMHLGAIAKSSSLVKEVLSYPPHGNRLSQMVNRIGELFRISQKSSYQTEPERDVFTFQYDYAGADKDLESVLSSALSWRVLVEDDSRRIKDDGQITSKEYLLNPIYAPKFGISFRKKRGVTFTLEEFKTILTGSSQDFERIKKVYQKKWKSFDSEAQQSLLEI